MASLTSSKASSWRRESSSGAASAVSVAEMTGSGILSRIASAPAPLNQRREAQHLRGFRQFGRVRKGRRLLLAIRPVPLTQRAANAFAQTLLNPLRFISPNGGMKCLTLKVLGNFSLQ